MARNCRLGAGRWSLSWYRFPLKKRSTQRRDGKTELIMAYSYRAAHSSHSGRFFVPLPIGHMAQGEGGAFLIWCHLSMSITATAGGRIVSDGRLPL